MLDAIISMIYKYNFHESLFINETYLKIEPINIWKYLNENTHKLKINLKKK